MKVSFPQDEQIVSKTITLPAGVLEKAVGRARGLRRNFSNYVRVLIEDDYEGQGPHAAAQKPKHRKA